jgi:hypothetical protein
VLEQIKETGKRIAYELYGPIFRRQVMEDVARSSSSTASANLVKYAEINDDAKELQTVDRTNYDNYGYRKIFVGQNKEQDPKTVT